MADVVYRFRQHNLEPIYGDSEHLLIVISIDIGNHIIILEAMEVENNFMRSTIGNSIITSSNISIHHPIQEWKWANEKRVTELVTLRDNFRTHQNIGSYTITGLSI